MPGNVLGSQTSRPAPPASTGSAILNPISAVRAANTFNFCTDPIRELLPGLVPQMSSNRRKQPEH
jgi:hypothetical protein